MRQRECAASAGNTFRNEMLIAGVRQAQPEHCAALRWHAGLYLRWSWAVAGAAGESSRTDFKAQ